MPDKFTIERAFELSVDGKHCTMNKIRVTQRREGYEYVTSHLNGAGPIKVLNNRSKAASSKRMVARPRVAAT